MRRHLIIALVLTALLSTQASTAQIDDIDRVVKIAVLQAGTSYSKNGNPGLEANFLQFEKRARDAAAQKPDLIVFPEYAITGWPYPQENVMNSVAEEIPGNGTWYKRYCALAQDLGIPVLGWIIDQENGKLYNSAFILDKDGEFVGKYHKVHANLGEQTWWGWSQGDDFNIIELDGVKYGISICADMWFPETVRCYELKGADAVIHLSIADDMGHLVPVRACDSSLPIVMAIFNGGSYAVNDQGEMIGKMPANRSGFQIFTLHPFARQLARKYGGQWNPELGTRNLRNPDAYHVLVDPSTRPPWTAVFFDIHGNPQTKEQLQQRFGGRYDAKDPGQQHSSQLMTFAAPWTSPFHVDPKHPYQLVNADGQHLFILNKTAWGYFGCDDPVAVLTRAREQGITVLRVTLEGRPYFSHLGMDLWPWGGTREQPDFSRFNDAYWGEVERRVNLAGQYGVGLDLVLYFSLRNLPVERVDEQRHYWEHALQLLGKYTNIVTWEIENENIRNEAFQDVAGRYFHERDFYQRPVCTSNGTSDDAVWPYKDWMDLAIIHTCTSSLPKHDLHDWYLATARNLRAYGKPAWNNESGREKRHQNDDPIHRRKQGWLWCASGGFWTYHSWEGCEGINNSDYRGPGQEFLRPMSDFFQALPFWELSPNYSACIVQSSTAITTSMATNDRSLVLCYLCSPASRQRLPETTVQLRLPAGDYRLRFVEPANCRVKQDQVFVSAGLGYVQPMQIPAFTDDLLLVIERIQ